MVEKNFTVDLLWKKRSSKMLNQINQIQLRKWETSLARILNPLHNNRLEISWQLSRAFKNCNSYVHVSKNFGWELQSNSWHQFLVIFLTTAFLKLQRLAMADTLSLVNKRSITALWICWRRLTVPVWNWAQRYAGKGGLLSRLNVMKPWGVDGSHFHKIERVTICLTVNGKYIVLESLISMLGE